MPIYEIEAGGAWYQPDGAALRNPYPFKIAIEAENTHSWGRIAGAWQTGFVNGQQAPLLFPPLPEIAVPRAGTTATGRWQIVDEAAGIDPWTIPKKKKAKAAKKTTPPAKEMPYEEIVAQGSRLYEYAFKKFLDEIKDIIMGQKLVKDSVMQEQWDSWHEFFILNSYFGGDVFHRLTLDNEVLAWDTYTYRLFFKTEHAATVAKAFCRGRALGVEFMRHNFHEIQRLGVGHAEFAFGHSSIELMTGVATPQEKYGEVVARLFAHREAWYDPFKSQEFIPDDLQSRVISFRKRSKHRHEDIITFLQEANNTGFRIDTDSFMNHYYAVLKDENERAQPVRTTGGTAGRVPTPTRVVRARALDFNDEEDVTTVTLQNGNF